MGNESYPCLVGTAKQTTRNDAKAQAKVKHVRIKASRWPPPMCIMAGAGGKHSLDNDGQNKRKAPIAYSSLIVLVSVSTPRLFRSRLL